MNTIYDNTFVLGQTSATNFVAGPGIKIDQPSEGVVRIGNDETVLWEGYETTSATLSEPITNFEKFKIKVSTNEFFEFLGIDDNHTIQYGYGNPSYLYFKMVNFKTVGTSLTTNQNLILNYGPWNGSSPTGFYYDRTSQPNWLTKVIGINRISGSNA